MKLSAHPIHTIIMSSEKKKYKKLKKDTIQQDNCEHVQIGNTGEKKNKKREKKEKHVVDEEQKEIEEQNEKVISHPESAESVEVSDSEIKATNDFFMNMINMIPAQFYFDEETSEDIREMKVASELKEKGKKGKRGHGSSESYPAAAKRAKFDPDSNQTVQKMEVHCQHEADRKFINASRHPADLGVGEDIRERLHRRLEELKQKRTTMGKGVYKGEKQRLKRRESKLKRKMKLKLEKSHKTVQLPKINGDISKERAKPIFNKDGKLVYSKFDFTDFGDKHKDKSKSEFSGKNYQRLLAKVEKRNEKLKKLKETNQEKGETMEEKMKWQSALQRAEGMKVKDNPEILKKALKSKEKQKQAKAKKWEARLERTEKMKDERQHKRQMNIKAQKQKNLDKKVKKLKKKGRLIPGF